MIDDIKYFINVYVPQQVQLFWDTVYAWLVDFLSGLLVGIEYYSFKFTSWLFQLSYDVAINLLSEFNFSTFFATYYALIPDQQRLMLDLLAFPEGINMVVTATVTRFVMGKLGVMS